MDFKEFKDMVMARAVQKGLTEYELYYQAGESVSVQVYGKEVDSFSAAREGGVCFRCITGGKMGYAATELLTPEEAAALVDRAVENGSVLEAEEQVFLTPGGLTYTPAETEVQTVAPTEGLIRAALETREALDRKDSRVAAGSSLRAVSEDSAIAIVNSLGLEVRYRSALTALIAEAVVEAEGEKANDHALAIGPLDRLDTQALADRAVEKALSGLGATVAPTGSYPVVFDPEAMAGLLGVFAPVFSGESAQKGLSRLAGREGSRIAGACVTLTDDPFYAESPIRIHFDAEGSPTYRKDLIREGVLQTLLHNRKTAHVAGVETTGNAAKAGYDAPISLRPFTLYLAAGDMTREALLEKAGTGVYIQALQGLHAGASPVTGDFSLQSRGFLIEEGKLTRPVKSFTVAGNFYRLLEQITGLSDKVVLPRATGMTNFGAPLVLVEGLSIAGK